MDSREKKLSLKHKISSIWGWLELGDLQTAQEEAHQLNHEELEEPESVDIFYEIARKSKCWNDCLKFGLKLTELCPDDPGTWVRYCNALFWSNQNEKARNLAIKKINEFPEEWDLVYNLACYLTKLQDFDEAVDALKKAEKMAGNKRYFQRQAILDQDLKPLWDHLGINPVKFFRSADIA